jgi:hypothetical protein
VPLTNCLLDPLTCIGNGISQGVNDAATSAWDSVCKSFASAAAELLKAFGQAFAALPSLNLASAGISSAYGICLAIAATVAALLVFGGVIRTAWTHDGSGIAQAVSGVAKAVLAWMLTAAVATAALQASDEITRFTVQESFGSQQALAGRLAAIVNWAEVTGEPGQAILGGSLLLVFALVGIALVIVLWFELLLRNAAIAVLIATSPIAAAGQASEATKAWWLRAVSATAQLIILKPVIALVFAVGFGMAGTSSGIESLLEGLLVLGLAAFSWPVIARFFTFGSVQASSSGLATVLGFLAGQASQSGGGGTAGVNPNQWSMSAENQTMAGRGGTASGPAAGGGTGPAALPGAAATGGASGAGSGAASGGGSGAAAMAGIGFVLAKAHQAGTALSGRMEQTAAHGGMHGAYPYSTVSGGQRSGARPGGQPSSGGGAPAEYAGPAGQQPATEAPPPQPPDPRPAQGPAGTLAIDDHPALPPDGEAAAPPVPGADTAEGDW